MYKRQEADGVVGALHGHGRDLAGLLGREVFLTHMQDVCAGQRGNVGAVIDCEELAVFSGDLGEDLHGGNLVASVDFLVAQLDDVGAAFVTGVQELAQIAAGCARVGAEVQAGGGEEGAGGGNFKGNPASECPECQVGLPVTMLAQKEKSGFAQ